VKIRLKTRTGWREQTKGKVDEKLNRLTPRTAMNPMMRIKATLTEVVLEKKKEEYTLGELAQITDLKIASIDADVEIYTDGSTSGDQVKGGAGVFAQDKDGRTMLKTWKAAGKLCSSYDGECVAMMEALQWIEEDNTPEAMYGIYTDSQSLMSALKSNDWKDTHKWLRCIKVLLNNTKKKITICWIPSHCNTFGNDKADDLANRGAKLDQANAPVTFRIVRAKIRNRRWEIGGEKAKGIFGERRKPLEVEKSWPAHTRRLYARLRSGHAKELRDYQHRFLKTDATGWCIHCDMEEAETINHILCDCPQMSERRQRIFGGPVAESAMVTLPEKCLEFLEVRLPKLRGGSKMEEDEGGGSPRAAVGSR